MTAPSEYFPVCRGSRKHIFVHTSIPASPHRRGVRGQFCYGGSPTPKHVCDTIKANQKPKHVVAGFKARGSHGVGLKSSAVGR
jgi:hypothetical protein